LNPFDPAVSLTSREPRRTRSTHTEAPPDVQRREFVKWLGALPLLTRAGEAFAEPLRRIAFGSCAQQDAPQPIWDAVLATDPELFLFLGDNIYGDTTDMAVLRAKYRQLGEQPGYRKLRQGVPVLAVWDDHDYGANDAGAEYPMKAESQQAFMDFFGVPNDSPRRRRAGVYDARVFGPPGRRVQVILLDLRYFRSPLGRREVGAEQRALGYGPYAPNTAPDATMLGAAQWRWLARQLAVPAELRLIASSVQVVASEHGWETWGQLPHERRRLFDLIRTARADGVLFLSGDVHWGELSRAADGPYPLYDFTSSALNQEWPQALNLPNARRVGTVVYPYPNFGTVEIGWDDVDPTVRLRLRAERGGEPVLAHELRLSELRGPWHARRR
jgi:alkaline phosphatase D